MKKIMMHKETEQYIVQRTERETDDVSTIYLWPEKEKRVAYIPGQFITVYLPESGTPQGKAYSISSAPCEHTIALSVQAMGEFSRHLTSLSPGDIVHGSLPYGYFYSESEDSDLVLIAAGIGIAPFRSQIIEMLSKNPRRNITLFYSAKTTKDIVFKKEFDRLESIYKTVRILYHITREKHVGQKMNLGRISGKKIMSVIGKKSTTEFFICGGISFTRDIWRDLRQQGVPEEMICTEAFFSH